MGNTINSDNYQATGIDIEGILAAPFIAAVQANSMMAKEQIQFLIDYCFGKKEDAYEPVMIALTITRHEIDHKPDGSKGLKAIKANFEVPLLTLIPLNSLAVQNIDVSFDMEITSMIQKKEKSLLQSSNNKKEESKIKLLGAISYDSKEAQVQGSKTQYQKKNNSKMSVTMKASPLPLPVGVTTLIDLYTKNMSIQSKES